MTYNMDYNEKIRLAYRLMKWSGWRTLSGMLCRDEDTDMLVRVINGSGPALQSLVFRLEPGLHFSNAWAWRDTSKLAPILDDPATLGCLLALVREAWGDPTLIALVIGVVQAKDWAGNSIGPEVMLWAVDSYDVELDNPLPQGNFTTEAEALVAALEAAP